MSRKLLAFLLSELQTVRITCGKCKAVTELTVDQASYRLDSHQCPVCKEDWHGLRRDNNESHLKNLMASLKALQATQSNIEIEFVMPDESE